MKIIAKENFIKILSNKIQSNFRYIIIGVLILFLVLIISQLYFYQKNNRILKMSILYEEALSNIDNQKFYENIDKISEDKNFFAQLGSLELIKKKILNKKYNEAYEEYINLLNNEKKQSLYLNILAIHAAYNLLDYLPSDKLIILLNYIDQNSSTFIGYYYELLFLISIKDNNLAQKNNLYDKIINHQDIPTNIKERIMQINEFETYK